MDTGPSQPQPDRRRLIDRILGNALGLVALSVFVLIGGTALAAGALPKNSVGTKQLKNGAVNAKKVKANSLTGTQINESTLAAVPSAANADMLDGKHASDFLSAGASVSNADMLDGKHAYDFLGVGATAPNSERLGNLLPSSFLNTGTNAGGDLAGTYPSPSIANGVITDAKVASANKDGAVNVPSLRTLGTGAQQAMPGNATPGGPPSGPAGGALSGAYPNPALDVSGGPCPNGEALINVSSQAVLACAPGVFADNNKNVAARRNAAAGLGSGEANTAFGSTALESNESGESNSAFGQDALASNTDGNSNSAFGGGTLNFNTTGGSNVAVGSGAMNNNISGSRNVAVGLEALQQNLNGNGNVALGPEAMVNNQTGSGNTAVGRDALSGPAPSANFNTAFGAGALPSNTTGVNNLALGSNTLMENTSGSNNVAISGGNFLTTGNNNVDIAAQGVAGESNTIRIGQGQTKTFLAGVFGVTTGGVASPVLVDGNGQLGTTSSSRRFKRDIRPLESMSEELMALRPVSFRYKRSYVGGPSALQFGLIAEQVAKVYPNLVVYGRDGKPSAVAYQELPALLLTLAQRQQRRVDRQEGKIHTLEAENRHQQAQISWLIQQVRGG
jgi:hypothetical protein